MPKPPFLSGAVLVPERIEDRGVFPFTLPLIDSLPLEIREQVCIFVGENGSGKSTLLQALAELAGLPPKGGGRNQIAHGGEAGALARAMRPQFRKRPRQSWFARGDRLEHLTQALKDTGTHHAYSNDPDALFADRDLATLSHGEALLAVLNNRARSGLLFLDEPEAALSPARQLTLCASLATSLAEGGTQVILATHSPILMSIPGAQILYFDAHGLSDTTLEETPHYQIMRGVLECPERYWRHLLPED